MKNYISPSFQSPLFNCPHSDCLVPARHSWQVIKCPYEKPFERDFEMIHGMILENDSAFT